jgi:hypothetical protein
MSSLHALLDNLVAAGSLYGWRMDAIVLGGMLWLLAAGFTQIRIAIA